MFLPVRSTLRSKIDHWLEVVLWMTGRDGKAVNRIVRKAQVA